MTINKPTILFITSILHNPPTGGNFLRIENSIKALSQISNLYLYSKATLESFGSQNALSFYQKYCRKFYFSPYSDPEIIERYKNRLLNILPNRSPVNEFPKIIFPFPQNDYRYILYLADKIKTDLIWLGYGNISYPLLGYIKKYSHYKVILDTDSVWSRFILRRLPYINNSDEYKKVKADGIQKKEEEIYGTHLADVTTAVSEIDALYYRKLALSHQQIHLFPNVIDIDDYQQKPKCPKNIKKPYLYIAGSFGPGSPMNDAAYWFVRKIWPQINLRIPNIHLYIVGARSNTLDIKDSHITLTGQLASVLPILSNADVALVPLRFESGTRFKILEAGACNIPVISTTLGVEGLPFVNQRHILIADDPVSFADATISLIRNKRKAQRLARNLHNIVVEKYNIETLKDYGIKILDYIMK